MTGGDEEGSAGGGEREGTKRDSSSSSLIEGAGETVSATLRLSDEALDLAEDEDSDLGSDMVSFQNLAHSLAVKANKALESEIGSGHKSLSLKVAAVPLVNCCCR